MGEKFDEKSLRWNYDFVDNLMYLKWQDAYKDLLEMRNPLEERIFTDMPEIEKEFKKIYKKNPIAAKDYLTKYVNDHIELVLKEYKELRNTLITKYTNNKQGS